MRVLVDIGHPAHVHFFRNPIALLNERGHEVLITSRVKECSTDLLEEFGLRHRPLSALSDRGGVLAMGSELVRRDLALWRVVREFRPDRLAAIGGTFIAHVGTLCRRPSLVFYDTEMAKVQNAITYPFASRIMVPRCYQGWLPSKRHLRYRGYHELSYLHPNYFTPDRSVALASGLAPSGATFLFRLVAWRASHDVGEAHVDDDLLRTIIEELSGLGKVVISAEGQLPEDLAHLAYTGRPADLHHLIAHCTAVVGESATVASESAVLGVPAVLIATTGRGYTDEQESRYGLVRNVRTLTWEAARPAVEWATRGSPERWMKARDALLADTIEVASFVADCLECYPGMPKVAH